MPTTITRSLHRFCNASSDICVGASECNGVLARVSARVSTCQRALACVSTCQSALACVNPSVCRGLFTLVTFLHIGNLTCSFLTAWHLITGKSVIRNNSTVQTHNFLLYQLSFTCEHEKETTQKYKIFLKITGPNKQYTKIVKIQKNTRESIHTTAVLPIFFLY